MNSGPAGDRALLAAIPSTSKSTPTIELGDLQEGTASSDFSIGHTTAQLSTGTISQLHDFDA